MARIPQVASKSDMAPEAQYVFDQVMQVFGRVRGPFSVLLHTPKRAEPLLPMVPLAREGLIVEPQLRQVAILAAVRERDANYVWAAQVDVARRVGLRAAVRAPAEPHQSRRAAGVRRAARTARRAVAGGTDGGGELLCRAVRRGERVR